MGLAGNIELPVIGHDYVSPLTHVQFRVGRQEPPVLEAVYLFQKNFGVYHYPVADYANLVIMQDS